MNPAGDDTQAPAPEGEGTEAPAQPEAPATE